MAGGTKRTRAARRAVDDVDADEEEQTRHVARARGEAVQSVREDGDEAEEDVLAAGTQFSQPTPRRFSATPHTPHTPMTPLEMRGEAGAGEDDSDRDPERSDQEDGDGDEEEEEGEDLYGDELMEDYERVEELDRYEVDSVAEAESASRLDPRTRRDAERIMQQRDFAEGRFNDRTGALRRLPAALLGPDEPLAGPVPRGFRRNVNHALASGAAANQNGDVPSPDDRSTPSYSQNGSAATALLGRAGSVGMSGDAELAFDDDPNYAIENVQGALSDWLKQERVRRDVRRRFGDFLRHCSDDRTGASVYKSKIRIMCAENRQSVVVSYGHLVSYDPVLAVWVADAPAEMLPLLDSEAFQVTLEFFPEYGAIHPEVFVRIAELPILDNLRDIRHIHLNCLIKVGGVVTRRTSVFPQLKLVKLDCRACGEVLSPHATSHAEPERMVQHCPQCGSRGPFSVNSEQSIFGNYQKLTLQEAPGSVPAGRLPRYKDVIMTGDLIDMARPGDEIEVTGIFQHNVDISANIKNGFPVFSTGIHANHVRKMEDAHADIELSDEDMNELRTLAADPRIAERIVASIAPSIYGHRDIKTAVAHALFSGVSKVVGDGHRTRGDINVLLLGDPGTAKSQILKYIEKTANRAVFTTGKGASAVGLTAAVRKDPVTREWTLEGGALVLADRGVCLIDEFDKMNDQDRTSIHEAMEQQSISISKAGIVTSLQARCSVIAAANPLKGRYDPSLSFFENVDLTEPILSRFDILLVVRDHPDASADETLAKFVVDSHVASHPKDDMELAMDANQTYSRDQPRVPQSGLGDALMSDSGIQLIPQTTLRKYLLYARRFVQPRLNNLDEDKLTRLYVQLRHESVATGGLPISVRHLESLVRITEAHARMHLREYVTDQDLDAAIAIVLESFFQSQKYSVMRGLKRTFHRFLQYARNANDILFYVLTALVRDYASANRHKVAASGQVELELDDFEARAAELGIQTLNLDAFYKSASFSQRDFILHRDSRKIVKLLQRA
ncbi:DNA replication licensing factor mcm2 [Porphyridium purpureum]|uniref:DNA replication licensing factor MCM2 n=1 Tax=Porphyridium purpureum TaxID=35688 RepID=A0A5J4YTN9_PORPP|nr:DNA replication licensing factor mcm2 [Porphyridium purpureum]|eukprot:POR6647..scf229_5